MSSTTASGVSVGDVRGCRDLGSNAASRQRPTSRVTHDRDTPYSRAASAWVRPSTTTAAITNRAFDMALP